jgi:hypothetical protein
MPKSVADAFPKGLPLVDGDLTVYINGPPQVPANTGSSTSAPNGSSGSITYTTPSACSTALITDPPLAGFLLPKFRRMQWHSQSLTGHV